MSDIMSTGVSALLAYRQALNTISNNISNANTVGYSREQTELQQNAVGGVSVRQVTRLTDAMVFARSLGDNSSYSRLNTFQQAATQIDGLTSGDTTGLSAPLQKFFSAVQGVAADPQSVAARQTFLSSADSLSSQFTDLQSQFDGMESDINNGLQQSVSEINGYASSIAKLNNQISLAQSGGQSPNDLLDQRDQLVTKLSADIGISTVKQGDGSLNIFIGGGQALVLGSTTQNLSLVTGTYGTGRPELAISSDGGSPVNINAQVSGGNVGGLLDTRSQLLDPAESKLGRIAVALTQSVNAQNAQGVDLNGAAGGNLFTPLSGTSLAAASNGGSAAVSVGYSNVSQLTGGNYVMQYNGSSWTLSDSGGNAVAMTGAGTAASPFVAAGLSLQVSGSASAGDSFLVQPTAHAAAQMGLATNDPSTIAAAAVGSGSNSADNTNANALAALSTRGVLDGGRTSIGSANTALVSQIGNLSQQASARSDAAQTILKQTQSQQDSVSGVNLDQEAADLVRYQQAYQAAAQVISIAQTLFQSLLTAAHGG